MYAEQWNQYRKRRFMFWCVLLGGFLFAALCLILLSQMLPANTADPMIFAIVVGWMLAYAVAGIRLTSWRCPRCRKEYFVRGILVNQLASRCLHRGLKKWDEGETEKDERFYSKDERFYSK
jgi:uncharacterized integral membrane protein